LKNYGQGPYARQLRTIEKDLQDLQKRIGEKMGVKESDTGLAPPNLWDTAVDRVRMSQETSCLQVARCTKIIRAPDSNAAPDDDASRRTANGRQPASTGAGRTLPGAGMSRPNADEEDKYVINVKQIAKFVVGLGDQMAPTDIEEGMRVG
jgi:26S proteasome regulatory subunit T1